LNIITKNLIEDYDILDSAIAGGNIDIVKFVLVNEHLLRDEPEAAFESAICMIKLMCYFIC
jgi:hypothetical protein